MNRQNPFFPSYYNYRYRNYMNNKYTPTFSNFQNTVNKGEKQDVKEDNSNINNKENSNIEDTNKNAEKRSSFDFKLGPLNIHDNAINIFGISLQIDDLILIVLIVLLFLQSNTDYILIIILGLILFNISFSSLNIFT